VQASDDEAEYRIYLERYPEGAFAELARSRLLGTGNGEPGVELAFWETVRESGNAEMLHAYLEKFPNGQFRRLAEILLRDIQE
jgi:adenylate cyclase